MAQIILPMIALTALGIAFFHAAIPTHWLPFVLTGRVQRWKHTKTLLVTILAGSGHVLFTAALGLLLAWMGFALSQSVGTWFSRVAGGALLLLGAIYIRRQVKGVGHHHSHGRPHADSRAVDYRKKATGYEERIHELAEAKEPAKTGDFFAITTLIALLIFSPCEAFVGFYLVGVRYGSIGFLLLTLVFFIGTVSGMALFTGLALAGFQKVDLGKLEKYEHGLIGVLLCAIGVVIILFEK